MRFLLLFLISIPVYAQIDTGTGIDGACTGATIETGGTFNCTTLIVDITHTPVFAAGTPALIIKVQGDVSISVPINLNGGIGSNIASSIASGGAGGPGAGDGGGFGPGDIPQPGSDASASSGSAAAGSATCGGGGGGGGFAEVVPDGIACPTGGTGGLAGSVVSGAEFSFGGIFRGGFGGGAGGDGPTVEIGTGGGGGGALHLAAGGKITISANITAVGGIGGTNTNDGGGGGGGSGGVIWIQTESSIINSGTMNASGGTGGTGGLGGDGGDGSRGFIRLEDADGVVGGSFLSQVDLISLGAATSGSSSLKSDISCGMVKSNNDQMLYQVILGFALIAMLKILSQSRARVSKMFARLY